MPSLEITTMVGCPLRCTYCPQTALKAAYGKNTKYMTIDTFRAILEKTPPHVRIDFSGMSEPWANPHAAQMLVCALVAGRTIAIYTTLVGMTDPHTVTDLLRKYASQVETLCLHLPDANNNMRGWKYTPQYEAALLMFFDLRHVLPRVEAMTMSADDRVHPSLDHLGIKLGHWELHTRAGNVGAPDGQPITPAPRHSVPVVCSFTPFMDQNVVLPNGDVILCCMSYSLKHRLGNLLEQDYYSIFAGQELGALRAENMRAEFSERSLCRTCNRATPLATVPGNRLMWGVAR